MCIRLFTSPRTLLPEYASTKQRHFAALSRMTCAVWTWESCSAAADAMLRRAQAHHAGSAPHLSRKSSRPHARFSLRSTPRFGGGRSSQAAGRATAASASRREVKPARCANFLRKKRVNPKSAAHRRPNAAAGPRRGRFRKEDRPFWTSKRPLLRLIVGARQADAICEFLAA